jgi:hypothetical protein
MKNYRQFIRQLPTNTVVCALGEFNPPTTAHELLIKTVQVVAEQRKADHIVYTVPTESLQEEKKSQFLNLMFPKVKIVSLGESFFSSVVKQLNEKYKNVIIIAGADQFDEFRKLKESASVEIISIGTKDPDAETAKMKQFATKGIYEDFKKSLPSTIRDIDGKRLMNELRIGMGIEPIKENLVLVKDKLREKYFRGEIFNIGELVESSGQHYEIVKRGSNHLLLKDQAGELVSKWITDVKEIKEGAIQPNGTDKIDTNSPEAAGNNQVQKPKGKVKGFLTFYNYDDKKKNVNEQNQIDELSTDLLARYKTASHASAKAADVSGNYAKGDKRFKGINKATVKQFDNDLKKHGQLKEEELEEAKKKVVCPECGKNPCECGEERPGMGTENKPYNDPFFKEEFELSEQEIDLMIEEIPEEELLGLDEHTEWDLVYEDNEEVIPPHPEENQIELLEVLSRQERLKGRIRLRRSQAKRTRTTKINVHRYANPQTINSRARRLAIKLIKKRMLRGRNPSKVSVGDKEQIEKQLAKRKDLVNRVAQKLVVRVRKVEKARMSKGKVKKGNMPSVF